jgi:hypothetical protein
MTHKGGTCRHQFHLGGIDLDMILLKAFKHCDKIPVVINPGHFICVTASWN